MKILLVDDDAFLRDMYATKFQEVGHTVEVASSGDEGLGKIEKDDFDVVLMDMVMPNMTGIDMIKKVQAGPKAKSTKCIVLSNQGEDRDKTMAKEAGAIGYIVKAESIPSEVVAKVQELVK
tara:strand:- start:426 stop:788 length:363 start_codon:yes stop_codon:yes gene_type:complete